MNGRAFPTGRAAWAWPMWQNRIGRAWGVTLARQAGSAHKGLWLDHAEDVKLNATENGKPLGAFRKNT